MSKKGIFFVMLLILSLVGGYLYYDQHYSEKAEKRLNIKTIEKADLDLKEKEPYIQESSYLSYLAALSKDAQPNKEALRIVMNAAMWLNDVNHVTYEYDLTSYEGYNGISKLSGSFDKNGEMFYELISNPEKDIPNFFEYYLNGEFVMCGYSQEEYESSKGPITELLRPVANFEPYILRIISCQNLRLEENETSYILQGNYSMKESYFNGGEVTAIFNKKHFYLERFVIERGDKVLEEIQLRKMDFETPFNIQELQYLSFNYGKKNKTN